MSDTLINKTVAEILAMPKKEIIKAIKDLKPKLPETLSLADLDSLELDELNALCITKLDPRAYNPTTKKRTKLPAPADSSDLAKANELLNLIKSLESNSVDEELVKKIVSEAIENIPPKKLEVTNHSTGKKIELANQHYIFPLILKLIEKRINVAMVGPAGVGKSTLARNVSTALNLNYYSFAFNAMASKGDLLGFVDANGTYRESLFYTAFKNGGLYLADEMDACNAGIATIMNGAVENRICGFPNGEMIEAHPDFVFIAAMNTYGSGADAQYCGRNRLDAATLDRFAFVTMGEDRSIKAASVGLTVKQPKFDLKEGGLVDVKAWFDLVEKIQNRIESESMKVIVSQRAVMKAAPLLKDVGVEHLKDMFLRKGLSNTDLKRLKLERV